MTQFNDRREAFESKYKHDQDLQFKVQVKTSRLLGLWAAGQLGLSGGEAESYAEQVVDADFEEPGFEDVIRKVMTDFSEKSLDITEHHLRVELDKQLEIAKQEVMCE